MTPRIESKGVAPEGDPREERLRSIDALRGIAALAVVFYHALTYSDVGPDWWWYRILEGLHFGNLGVVLFFVISGFCIHSRWAQAAASGRHPTVSWTGFWRRRFFRLYPPYFVALSLSMASVVLAYVAGLDVPLLAIYPEPQPSSMLLDFGLHLGMLHGFHPVYDFGAGNPVFWTLAREEQLYLLYLPLLALRRRWAPGRITVGVSLLGLAIAVVGHQLSGPSAPWIRVSVSGLVLWVQWCLGMLAVEAFWGQRRLPAWCSWPWFAIAWWGLAYGAERFFSPIAPLLWGLGALTIVHACVQREASGNWPTHAVARWLSRVGLFSYSLYLVHYPVRAAVKYLLGPWIPTGSIAAYWLFVAVFVITGYYAGRVFFVLVERHFVPGRTGALPVVRSAAIRSA